MKMWWRNSSQPFKDAACQNQLPQILMAIGLVASTTQAAKLLKNYSVEMRPWDMSEWWTKVELKTKLPAGAPLYLRVGKRVWGLQIVMFPVREQTLDFWEELITTQEAQTSVQPPRQPHQPSHRGNNPNARID
jgi:hypothetical protein